MTTSTDPRGTRSQRFFARWYPGVMDRAERAGQAAIRARHLAAASGRTLDIGTGNGFSVAHYPARVSELVMLEPNPALRRQLQGRTQDVRAAAWRIVDGDATALPFDDASFDTVAASLLFCSLDDPAAALAEIARVLRPGGTFLFHEHVRGRGLRRVLQEVAAPLQVRVADGCRPNRDFLALLASPTVADLLEVVEVEHRAMPGGAATVVPLVVGRAVRR